MDQGDRSLIAGIVASAIEISDRVAPLASITELDGPTAGACGQQVARLLNPLLERLNKVPGISEIPADVLSALRGVARIVKGTRTECVTFGDVVIYLMQSDLRQLAEKGWQALVRSKPENQGLLAWADEGQPPTDGRAAETVEEQIQFLEAVRDAVHFAAVGKRQQLKRGYSDATLSSMVRAAKWDEARTRIGALKGLSAAAVDMVARVLRRELTSGTVERIDELLTPAMRGLRDAWEDGRGGAHSEPAELIAEQPPAPVSEEPPAPVSAVSKKPKRSTERGEGQVKLIAALTKHHQYADGSCLNLDPVGNNELAGKAKVANSTASTFFNKEFNDGKPGGHTKYRAICAEATHLLAALKLLNQEFSPHHLFGAKPPDGRERQDEE